MLAAINYYVAILWAITDVAYRENYWYTVQLSERWLRVVEEVGKRK